ncbi:putative 50S ribosomal protein L3 [Cardiosporidium cionae]|uniref:Large ribosomal subunit protein uL3m n=1 Tax=Cardiosporidium cionae TaxID=476202 RepID=A0ABQ7J9D0_9APIC|nr:putative 50S ribosomal protein L3 [Cardiosporidium cionae]|eukprot:KAF8820561.1 putative 50S ribosomal protein L3 [Cardiosporidium cionae]
MATAIVLSFNRFLSSSRPLLFPQHITSLQYLLQTPFTKFPFLQQRLVTSKWKRRLSRQMEHSHYLAPRTIPEYEYPVEAPGKSAVTPYDSNFHVKIERNNKRESLLLNREEPSQNQLTVSKSSTKSLKHPIFSEHTPFVPPRPRPSPELQSLRPTWRSRRTGILAYKLGCMAVWNEWGERIVVTVCQVDRCSVLEVKSLPTHGYESLVLGIGYRPLDKQTKPNIGRFIKVNTGPKHVIKEFKCTSDAFLPVGHEFSVRHFTPGQWVFVSGWTKAKGFTGVMKRWGFAGGSASHGTEHKAHSAAGSISQGKSVNTVWKFKKMAGHHGPDPRTVNCKLFRIETERNLLFLQGAIPGSCGSTVKISDARGRTCAKNKNIDIPFPTFVPKAGESYPVTVQCPPAEIDPFTFPDLAVHEY